MSSLPWLHWMGTAQSGMWGYSYIAPYLAVIPILREIALGSRQRASAGLSGQQPLQVGVPTARLSR